MNNESYYINANEIREAISSYDNDLNLTFIGQVNVRSDVNEYLSSSVDELVGPVWDGVRNNLTSYSNLLAVSNSVNEYINQTNKDCLTEILEFLGPDTDLNTADLEKYEKQKKDTETEIQNLKAQNEQLAQVPEKIYVVDDENGNPIYEHNPLYDAAMAQIAANNAKIANELTDKLNEANYFIDKINRFKNEILPSINDKLELTKEKVNAFLNKVDHQLTSNTNFWNTLFVGGTSVLSGIGKVYENVYDAKVWVDSKITSVKIGLASSVARLFGQDDVALIIDGINAIYSSSNAKWIKTDHVEMVNKYIYEKTEIGRDINAASNMQYDSDKAKKIQETTSTVAKIGLEVGTTLATGNPAAAAIIGSLVETGSAAEEAYSEIDNPTLSDGTGHILLNSVEGAVEGYMVGKSVAGVKTVLGGVKESGGIVNYARQGIRDVSSVWKNQGKGNLGRNITSSLKSVDNLVQVTGTTADTIDKAITSDEAINKGEIVKDALKEYGLDAIVGYGGSRGKYIFNSMPVKDVIETIDTIGDTDVFSDDAKRKI